MADLRYKVVVDDAEAKRKLRDLLKGTGVSSDATKSSITNIDAITNKLDQLLNKLAKLNTSGSGATPKIKAPISDSDIKTIQSAISSMASLSDKASGLYNTFTILRTSSDSLKAAKIALKQQLKDGAISADEYAQSLTAVERQQHQVRNELLGLNHALKQVNALEKVAAGSLEEARLKYNQLTAAIVKAEGAMTGSNPAVGKMVLEHQKLRKEIDAMEQKLGMYQRNVGNYASGWNGMQNSINQLTRELPAFTFSAQTGFMAISNNLPIMVDEIKKAVDANKALSAEGKKGVPVWKQLAGSLLSWQTAMMLGITLMTVYGKEIAQWIKGLFGTKKSIDNVRESQNLLNKAFEDSSYRSAVQDVNRLRSALEMAKNGFVSKKSVVEEYNKTIGRVTGEVKTLSEVESFLIKNADNYIKMTLYKAASNLALEEAAKSAMEAEKSRLKELTEFENRVTETMPGARSEEQYKQQQRIIERQRQERKNAEIKSSEDAQKTQENIANKFLKQSQDFASKMNISIFGNDPSEPKLIDPKKIAEEYKALLDEIKGIDEEYSRILLSSNQVEILALEDKFKKIRESVSTFNKENPSKAIPMNLIDAAYSRSRANLIEKQRIDEQKKADEKAKEEQKKADEAYAELLKKYANYSQQRAKLIEESNKEIALLESKGEKDRAKEAKRQLEETLKENFAQQIENDPTFKKAIENINTASQGMLADAFKTGKATMLSLIDGMEGASEGQKSELRKMFSKFFDDGIKDAELGKLDNLGQLVGSFDQLVSTSLQFASNLDSGVDAVRSMIDVSGQLVRVLGSLSKNESFSKLSVAISGSLGIFAAFGGILSSVTSFFAQKRAQEDQQRTAAADNATKTQLRATEAITRALEKQVELMNEIYGVERLEKYSSTLSEIEKTWKEVNGQLSGKYMLTGDAKIDEIITKMNNGMTRSEIAKGVSPMSKEMTFIYETFAKIEKGTYGVFKPLSGDLAKAKEQLIQLERQSYGKVDENTQNIINQLREQIDLYEKTLNKLAEEKTGNAFSSLLSDVTNLFFNEGENSAEAWSQGFDKILENYLMQKFSREFLQERMQGWYNMMNDFAGDGIDASERDTLKKEWDAIQKAGEDRLNQMKDILDLNGSTEKNITTLKGKLSRELTEKTGGEIVGIFRAGYDVWKQQLVAIQAQSATNVNILAIANEKLIALNAIQVNTANTVQRLDVAVKHLDTIVKNTSKSGRSAEGMGL